MKAVRIDNFDWLILVTETAQRMSAKIYLNSAQHPERTLSAQVLNWVKNYFYAIEITGVEKFKTRPHK